MTRHPAKFSDPILEKLDLILPHFGRVLDPFGGVGKLHRLERDFRFIYTMDLEWEWVAMGGDLVANALYLPFPDKCFAAVCTSPTYGNRMADHHNAKDGSKRNTYTHALGRQLHPDNSGRLQWGEAYRAFHASAYLSFYRVLADGGRMIVNVSNHIRRGQEVDVVGFHQQVLTGIFGQPVEVHHVATPRLRFGQNYDKRVDLEYILVHEKRSH